VAPHCPWHDPCPFALLFAFKYFLDCLENQDIGSLDYSIGLWVVYRCEGDLCPNLVIEIFEHYTIEILGIIDHDFLKNSVMADDVLADGFLDGCRGYIGYML
jgi:hypothetical protein